MSGIFRDKPDCPKGVRAPENPTSCYQLSDWSRVAKEEIMIIEWFSVSTFDCGASSFLVPGVTADHHEARGEEMVDLCFAA